MPSFTGFELSKLKWGQRHGTMKSVGLPDRGTNTLVQDF